MPLQLRAFLWLARRPVQWVDAGVGELYRVAGLVPLMLAARSADRVDQGLIDGAVDGLAHTVRGIGGRLRSGQRGRVQESLALSLVAVAVILVVFLVLD